MEILDADDRAGRFERIAALARRALEEAARRGFPPEPRVYEVFYVYAQGADAALTAAVDAQLPAGGDANLDALERIHEAHLAVHDPAGRYAELGEQVEQELGELNRALARRAETDDAFRQRLVTLRDGVSLLMRPGAVKRAARELIDEVERRSRDAAFFGAELEAARAQIGELQAELQELRRSAFADHLTGLANRRRLEQVLDRAVAARAEQGAFSLALCDLDHFKRINDRFGHAVGDSVLKQFSRLLRQTLKGKDTAARYGGEEFVLILPQTELLGARHLAEQVRQALAARVFVVSGTRERLGAVTASFGVAEHAPGESAEALLARADAALYRAKQSGRNRVIAARRPEGAP